MITILNQKEYYQALYVFYYLEDNPPDDEKTKEELSNLTIALNSYEVRYNKKRPTKETIDQINS